MLNHILKYLINNYPRLVSKITKKDKHLLKSWVNYRLRKERLKESKDKKSNKERRKINRRKV